MRSLFAWVTRRPRGSWRTHHAGCTQGFPLGTHSHLCQLLWREGGREMDAQKHRQAPHPDSPWPLGVQAEKAVFNFPFPGHSAEAPPGQEHLKFPVPGRQSCYEHPGLQH